MAVGLHHTVHFEPHGSPCNGVVQLSRWFCSHGRSLHHRSLPRRDAPYPRWQSCACRAEAVSPGRNETWSCGIAAKTDHFAARHGSDLVLRASVVGRCNRHVNSCCRGSEKYPADIARPKSPPYLNDSMHISPTGMLICPLLDNTSSLFTRDQRFLASNRADLS
jgi:hypothetical protein